MKAHVNPDKCIGCGSCQAICSDVFEIQDDGLAHVVVENISEDLMEDVRDAADSCPTDAIEVEE